MADRIHKIVETILKKDATDKKKQPIQEHKQRALARRRVISAQEDLALFKRMRELAEPELQLGEKSIAGSWETRLAKTVEHREKDLKEKMTVEFCAWEVAGEFRNGNMTWRYSYTTDSDGDGFYWYKIALYWNDKGISTFAGKAETGKRRKSEAAHEAVEKKYREHLNLFVMVGNGQGAKAAPVKA